MARTLQALLIEPDSAATPPVVSLLRGATDPGMVVERATDLRDGLQQLKDRSFDVVLLSLGSKDAGDLEAVAMVLAAAPLVPLIVLANPDTPAATHDTLRVGHIDVFVKSRIDPDALIDAIRRRAGRKDLFTRPPRDETPPADPAVSFAKVRVLLVEDNPGDAVLIRRMFAGASAAATASFEITEAPTLADALEKLRNRVDVVLLDLNLPDSRGLETLGRLRASAPSVPTIVLTGIDDRRLAVEALDSGANDYFVKERLDARLLAQAVLRSVGATAAP